MSLWPELLGLEFAMRQVDAGGIATRALVAGPESGPPLLFLHGTGGHLESHLANVQAHARHFRCYLIDMLGHGYTAKPTYDYTVDAHIDHILAFLDAVGAQRAHISGESLGGWVAVRLAARHPERVGRLVLNTAGGRTNNLEANARLRELSLKAVRDPSLDSVRARLEWLFHDKTKVTDDLVETRYRIYAQPGFATAMERICCLLEPAKRPAMMLTDDELRAIRAPTLVIWTSHDPQGAVSVGTGFATLIPDARLEVMEGCGHWPQFEDRATFDRLSLAHLLG